MSTLTTLRDCADRCLKNAHHHPHTSSEFRRWLEMAEKLAKAAEAIYAAEAKAGKGSGE